MCFLIGLYHYHLFYPPPQCSKLLQGAFGDPHNKRQQIVHTEKSTGKRRGTRLSKNSVHQRRGGEQNPVGISLGCEWVTGI